MESYWPTLIENPSGDKSMDDFAVAIDKISKVVFSRTLKTVHWKTARVAQRGIKEEIVDLKQQPGKDIFVGSPSLIVAAANLGLIDEFQLSVQPTIIGKGLQLFKNINNRIDCKLLKTKTFGCGAVTFYYEPVK
jgi:dihydrofolate reductase